MPTVSLASNDGVIRPLHPFTSTSVMITMKSPTETTKTITSYQYRAAVRVSPGGRVIKNYNTSTGGGLVVSSGPSGILKMSIGASDLSYYPYAEVEVVEYAGKALSGPITDRHRFQMQMSGGPDLGY